MSWSTQVYSKLLPYGCILTARKKKKKQGFFYKKDPSVSGL